MTSPQAFDGLRLAGRAVRRPDLTLATEDHNVPTLDWDQPIKDPVSRTQVETLRRNAEEFGVRLHPLGDLDQGIVHVVGPQLGLTQPGMTIVCGDSHTSTHGAFGALAFGIGTSEVEHVLATQTLPQARPKTMAVTVNGALPEGVTAKDLVLTLITHTGTGGGQGYVVEYRGPAIEALSMEARMTVCNMSIEWGAKAGLIAPDRTTFDYLEGRPEAPTGAEWDAAVAHWQTLVTDDDAVFDEEIELDASTMTPVRHLGHQPGPGRAARRVASRSPTSSPRRATASAPARRWSTWASRPVRRCATSASTPSSSARAPTAGSRTSARAAEILGAARSPRAPGCSSYPGSVRVRLQAEDEGLDVDLQGGRRRVARGRLLDVPGHEPRPARTPGAQRVDVQPQLRGPSGQGRTHPPGLGAGRRRHRDPRHPQLARRPRARRDHHGRRPVMDAFTTHTGIGVPLRRSNVDTDQIIPAVYLKRVTRTGFEDGLFAAWRNDPRFVLNQPAYAAGSVLVAGPDFGTGSSREHAVWALQNYGFRVVLSPRFGDIFRGNSGKAGLLAAQVDDKVVLRLWDLLEAEPGTTISVDLRDRTRPRGLRPRRRRGLLRHRRLHPLASARGSRRHLADAGPRGRHRGVRRRIARPGSPPRSEPSQLCRRRNRKPSRTRGFVLWIDVHSRMRTVRGPLAAR